MAEVSIAVRADWDQEAQVWVASSTDIQGLSVEARSFEALVSKVCAAVEDLLEANGGGRSVGVPVNIMAERLACTGGQHGAH